MSANLANCSGCTPLAEMEMSSWGGVGGKCSMAKGREKVGSNEGMMLLAASKSFKRHERWD